ncbi:MAG TPA: secretin and TonB N-terminal domain-containing protein [Bacteroidota bacterium]|nr:secretin and TonB N-terminal domain-containing protein [Bacteroidota bacterium]
MKIKIIFLITFIITNSINLFCQQADTLQQRFRKMPQRQPFPQQVQDKTIQSQLMGKGTEQSIPTDVSSESTEMQNADSSLIVPTPVDTTMIESESMSKEGKGPEIKKEIELPQGAKDSTTLSFRDTDIRDIFRGLALQHKLNIFVDNSINKRVTISLNQVQVYEAIKFICEQNNLRLEIEGGIFKVLPPLPLPKPVPPPPKVPMVYYENGLLSVWLKNDDLESVITEIQKKSGKNILILSGTTGSLSGNLKDVDFDIGFTQLLNNNGFAVQKKNGIYIVSRLDYFVGQQQAPQGQKAGPYWISVKDSVVTLDVTNAPLERVIADMIRQLNTDVVFYNTVTGTVTARATNVNLDKALDIILRNTNYGYRESEGIYFIGEKTNKALMATKLIKLKYLRADKIIESVPQSISSQATIKVMNEHNGIVIIAPNDVISEAEEFIQQIDKPVAQVLIEAIVVDFDRTKALDLGVKAGYLSSGDSTVSFSRTDMVVPNVDMMFSANQLNNALQNVGAVNIGKLPNNFFVQLKAMEQRGVANIQSRPLLATLNGHPATLSVGTTFYFKLLTTTSLYNVGQGYLPQTSEQFTTVEADTKLEITPYVGSDGQITVELKPDFKTPIGTPSNGIPPTINRRALSSTLVVREGETIVVGGLIQEVENVSKTQVPILGSIPLLGYLFSSTNKSTNKTELLIYITPHISFGEEFQNVSLPTQK